MKTKEGEPCTVTDCPRWQVGKCELSKLDSNSKWHTNPNKCTHYKWRTLRKGEK